MTAPADFGAFRTHGGNIEAARLAFPDAPQPWIDLSTGISPWAYSYEMLAPAVFTRLPEPARLAELEAEAAASFGVPTPSTVIATPGSDLALRTLAYVWRDRSVAVVRPGYSGHVAAWSAERVVPITVNELERAAREHDVLILANPNNPDGRTVERERLLALADELARRGGTLVVDEAFADAVPDHTLCPVHRRGIVILRSFGKFFGLAGVRLGFAIVPPEWVAAFRRALGDWPVSGPAIAIGHAAYRDREWQALQRTRLRAAATRLDALLWSAGLHVLGGTPLYRLVRCESSAEAVFLRLGARGILTRPFTSDPALLRIGLPGEEWQWTRLAEALPSRYAP